MNAMLQIHVAEQDADAQRLDLLIGFLRQELLQLDVRDVAAVPAGPPPAGARSLDATTIGGLLVTLGQSTHALQTIVSAIRVWLGRGATVPRAARLEISGDVLELTDVSIEDQERLIGLFINRHR